MLSFKKLGKKILKTRLDLNLTQVDVAREISIETKRVCEQSTISRIENGQYTGRFLIEYLAYLKAKGADLDKVITQ